MTDILDLPPEIREKALARLGITEDEYRRKQAESEAAVAEAEALAPPPRPEAEVPEKFKDTPVGVVHDD